MPKTEMIRARVEPDLKKEVESIFSELGLSPSTAINLFYRQVKIRRGLPFNVVIPNETTLKTFQDTEYYAENNNFYSRKEVCEKLDISDSYLYQLTASKCIPFVKIGKVIKFPKDSIDDYIALKTKVVNPNEAINKSHRRR